jgi:hypothetical protein
MTYYNRKKIAKIEHRYITERSGIYDLYRWIQLQLAEVAKAGLWLPKKDSKYCRCEECERERVYEDAKWPY